VQPLASRPERVHGKHPFPYSLEWINQVPALGSLADPLQIILIPKKDGLK